MTKFRLLTMTCIICVLCTAAAAQLQTFTTEMSFTGYVKTVPGALIQYTNGDLMGIDALGGTYDGGLIYEMTPRGKEAGSYSFSCVSPCNEEAIVATPLLLASDGNFYGMTAPDIGSGGTIFKLTPGGQFTTIYNFCSLRNCADGWNPRGPLVQGPNGNLYGTTVEGGTGSNCPQDVSGCGTLFEITMSGKLTALYEFCSLSNCADGRSGGPLTLGTDGNFYGTTNGGYGTFFRVNPTGGLTTLYQFTILSGGGPSGVIEGNDGNFYGTTSAGGMWSNGTVFKITPSGEETTLYNFCAKEQCVDGEFPRGGVIQGTDGNFYGTTSSVGGDDFGFGTIFQITPAGQLTTLHSFCSENPCPNGAYPMAALVQYTDGNFYGTTSAGGAGECQVGGCGTVFSFSMGLGPFVSLSPAFGKVGYTAGILGNHLTGATSVTFNGIPATAFTVKSDTFIKATVPAGATTGTIVVTTPSGTLSSNVAFQVVQ